MKNRIALLLFFIGIQSCWAQYNKLPSFNIPIKNFDNAIITDVIKFHGAVKKVKKTTKTRFRNNFTYSFTTFFNKKKDTIRTECIRTVKDDDQKISKIDTTTVTKTYVTTTTKTGNKLITEFTRKNNKSSIITAIYSYNNSNQLIKYKDSIRYKTYSYTKKGDLKKIASYATTNNISKRTSIEIATYNKQHIKYIEEYIFDSKLKYTYSILFFEYSHKHKAIIRSSFLEKELLYPKNRNINENPNDTWKKDSLLSEKPIKKKYFTYTKNKKNIAIFSISGNDTKFFNNTSYKK